MLVNSEYIPLKSLHHAKMILEGMVEQKDKMTFDLTEGKKVKVAQNNEGKIDWLEVDYNSTIPVEFQPSIELTMDEAVQELYKNRKYFNRNYL